MTSVAQRDELGLGRREEVKRQARMLKTLRNAFVKEGISFVVHMGMCFRTSSNLGLHGTMSRTVQSTRINARL